MCIHSLEGHKGAVNCFTVMDDKSILSVGTDKNIIVWSWNEITKFKSQT